MNREYTCGNCHILNSAGCEVSEFELTKTISSRTGKHKYCATLLPFPNKRNGNRAHIQWVRQDRLETIGGDYVR